VDLSSRVRAAELEARFPGLLASILKSYKKELSRPARAKPTLTAARRAAP
jgi:hypothetical protein